MLAGGVVTTVTPYGSQFTNTFTLASGAVTNLAAGYVNLNSLSVSLPSAIGSASTVYVIDAPNAAMQLVTGGTSNICFNIPTSITTVTTNYDGTTNTNTVASYTYGWVVYPLVTNAFTNVVAQATAAPLHAAANTFTNAFLSQGLTISNAGQSTINATVIYAK